RRRRSSAGAGAGERADGGMRGGGMSGNAACGPRRSHRSGNGGERALAMRGLFTRPARAIMRSRGREAGGEAAEIAKRAHQTRHKRAHQTRHETRHETRPPVARASAAPVIPMCDHRRVFGHQQGKRNFLS
ncbi:hypothetical protein, partial [Burkholderia pseudomallei]|uniref:hypothetical protein n=1 Tax=Burkholderia pseudomallei TaxID=28450 RepID=UPI00207C26FD